MKLPHILWAVICVTAALFSCNRAKAQPTNTPSQTFFQTAASWMTSFNTNNPTFFTDRVNVSTGPETQQGIGMDELLSARVNAFDLSKSATGRTVLFAGADLRNADIAGTLVAAQGNVGLSLTKWDVKLSGAVGGGYNWVKAKPYVEPSVALAKSMTVNTYTELRIGMPVFFVSQKTPDAPSVSWMVGFTF